MGHAGIDSFRFTGRLGGRRLKSGAYRLLATPLTLTKAGRARSASFQIVK
jgi:hypothetical protein